jgi:hypothetical protein
MRTVVLATLLSAGPAMAQGLQGQALCDAIWAKVTAEVAPVSGRLDAIEGDWCVVRDLVLDLPGSMTPDWQADRVQVRGAALAWALDGVTAPERLEVQLDGLSLKVATGMAQTDYLLSAQARAYPIKARLSLAWDAPTKVLAVEGLEIDFPGANRLQFSAQVGSVDLSSFGAAQMSATGFALREAELYLQTHGLFETYVLVPFGPLVLPYDGDMQVAETALKGQALGLITALPVATVPEASKDALRALVAELPNPKGALTLSLRAPDGFGPARLTRYAIAGMPATMADAGPLFQGVTLDIGWTHADAP